MKILRITLNNLASLSGTHTVDFTRDPLRSAGLFAISGATGAGKSTLLDALCLALYDSTPRLQQVGRLAELAVGEKQNDPRMLLRRGAGQGFSEVAFVGVDDQPWTSRWSVRRSHNKADGTLQHVEMVLYRGHITSGGEGPVAEGGRKTAVLKAIEEKIGLTFEQFTRAVLLAQNDFATFLRADDKERAEILQALTGTEHFEAISRAVYARATTEKQALESLKMRLKGNEAFTVDARLAAEAAAISAAEKVLQFESRLQELESHVAWFRLHARITEEKKNAHDAWKLATEKRDAASLRHTELSLTESVSLDARPLRSAERHAHIDVETATRIRLSANAQQETHTTAQTERQENCRAAEAALAVVVKEQSDSKPLLTQARELDAKLEPLQVRFTRSSDAVADAKSALLEASTRLETATLQRTACLEEQDALQHERKLLAMFVPFVDHAGKWLDRIDRAITARDCVLEARGALNALTGQLQENESRLANQRQSEPDLQAACDAATKSLQEAVAAEQMFDAEQLAADRSKCDDAQHVLTRLCSQFRELQTQRERAEEISSSLEELAVEQSTNTATLKELQEVALPAAAIAFDAARRQLELIQAAVSDDAKRLRTTLQDGEECPVCGSTDHRWSQHQPDPDAAAVKAAKTSVRDFETRRDEVQQQIARLDATIKSQCGLISTRQTEYEKTQRSIDKISFDAQDHAEIAVIMALPLEDRLSSAEDRPRHINDQLKAIAEKEHAHRRAMKETNNCRKTMEQAHDRLHELKQRLGELEKQHGIARTETLNAARALETGEGRFAECMSLLSELWTGLPAAESEFEEDARRFRTSFENATTECSRIETRLVKLASTIQETNAAIQPLQESQITAQKTLDQCESELQSVANEQRQHLEQRSQLFEGRSADVVEAEILQRVQEAAAVLEESVRHRNDANINLASSTADLESSHRAFALAESRLAAAHTAMVSWLTEFAGRTSRQLSVEELDEILARDDAWLKAERAALDRLDHDVKSAEGAFQVHSTQLQKHLAARPTQEEQSVVLAALETLRAEFAAAKEVSDGACAVILSDDERRTSNLAIANEIKDLEKAAEPWLKLNELLGSADGAKFRMIAQRRTLDILLRHANAQLNLLAIRYRLERLPESLNLIVIDRDMGDERRSVHSLSGGESFLVSLALALGLASLASNRLRIESLFIDEGFGSLDPETLNTAMSALMHLEAQGRKVGVISHVTAMTDAIPVQINVLKGRGGASRIVVPGATVPEVVKREFASGTSDAAVKESLDTIAARILEILQRKLEHGKHKVSSKALREELGCGSKEFKAAQLRLDGKVVTDGRSLRLVES